MLPLLASCVTYYYPAVEQADGVYYAADDPGYSDPATDYVAVGYYPWWSVDYFYLGYGYRSSRVSIGFGYPGYPYYGWAYYPYYYPTWHYDPWYYRAWYAPVYYPRHWHGHYAYSPGWNVHYRHYRDYRHDRGEYGGHGGHRASPREGHDDGKQYADRGHSRNDRGEVKIPRDGGVWSSTGAPVRRSHVAPVSSQSGRGGMTVANSDGGKWSRSRLEPSSQPRVVGANPSPARSERRPESRDARQAPPRVVRSDSSTTRSRGDTKVGASRTMPVNRSGPVVSARSEPVRSPPARRVSVAPPRNAEPPRAAAPAARPSAKVSTPRPSKPERPREDR